MGTRENFDSTGSRSRSTSGRIGLDPIRKIWPKVTRFSRAKWILDGSKYGKIENILRDVRPQSQVERLVSAIAFLAGPKGDKAFTRNDVRLRIGVASETLGNEFHVDFSRHARRDEKPGGAPVIGARYQKIIRRLSNLLRRPIDLLDLDSFSADRILAFLNHLERDRGNCVRTRNARLAALRCFTRFALAYLSAYVSPQHRASSTSIWRRARSHRPLARTRESSDNPQLHRIGSQNEVGGSSGSRSAQIRAHDSPSRVSAASHVPRSGVIMGSTVCPCRTMDCLTSHN